MSSSGSWRASVLIAIAVVAADQLTKHWAVNELVDKNIEVFWTLQWNLAFNSGMAFSRGQGLGPLIAVAATLVIVWLLMSLRGAGGRMATVGMGLVIGGAAGNLVDRLFRGDAWLRGAVVDFIDFQWFPIFNIADIAINVGAGLLILNAILSGRRAVQPDEDEVSVGGPDGWDDDASSGDATPEVVAEPVDARLESRPDGADD